MWLIMFTKIQNLHPYTEQTYIYNFNQIESRTEHKNTWCIFIKTGKCILNDIFWVCAI